MRFSKNIEQLIISHKHSTRDEILQYIEQATTFSRQLEINNIFKNAEQEMKFLKTFRNKWDSQKPLEIDEILKKHWAINNFSQTFNQRWDYQIYWASHNIFKYI